MRGFWLNIGLRALAVFVIGLGVVAAGRYAVSQAEAKAHEVKHFAVEHAVQAAQNAAEASVRAVDAQRSAVAAQERAVREQARALERVGRVPGLAGLAHLAAQANAGLGDQPFVVDGDRIGTIERLHVRRSASNEPLRLTLTVKLADGAAAPGCDLSPVVTDEVDVERGFQCASGDGLVSFGTVRFEPGGRERALSVDAAKVAEMAKGDPVDVVAELGGPVRINVRENGREKVNIVSSPDGASLVVTKDDGKVVRISAGSNGVAVTVDSSPAK